MRKALALLGATLAGLTVVLLIRAWRLTGDPIPDGRPAPLELNEADLVETLSGFIRLPTVSYKEVEKRDAKAFQAVAPYLKRRFPLVHRHLEREEINDSLLFTWEGTEASRSVLLLAHFDVVPVPPGSEKSWQVPPFEGRVAGGYVWGRGALDDKSSLLGILEAVEALLRAGRRPRPTVRLAFGHDEEIGGPDGAKPIAALLESRGVKTEMILDEGGFLVKGALPGVSRTIAFVGIAEKGYTSVTLTAQAQGGHSSMPPAKTAIGRLARAVHRLETNPFPARLQSPTREMLLAVAPELGLGKRLAIANLWLLEPLLVSALGSFPPLNAAIRTTTAPTIFQAGVKDNVLPQTARAVVNFRLMPGEREATLLERIARIIDDPEIALEAETHGNPSRVSDPAHPTFRYLAKIIQGRFPGVRVAPNLTIAGTDTKHYANLSSQIYRFLPFPVGSGDMARIHGNDERVKISDYLEAVRFYHDLIAGL